MFNTKVVSCMLIEMLVFIIKKLIEAGQSDYIKKKRINVNLIKFSVADLMRGMIVGSKK